MIGLLVVNKPPGITPHDVVDRVRDITGETRVGHAGTLDPLAQGVLILLVGREMTRRQQEFMRGEKTYEASLFLGALSSTDDAEGEITPDPQALGGVVAKKDVLEALRRFEGKIKQTPPAHSAVKVGGRRAYAIARAGKQPNIKPRTISISNIALLHYAWPKLTIRIVCGKGTYIRSLARDIGSALGCGAYLSGLVRTRSGDFTLANAVSLDALTAENVSAHLVKAVDLP